MSGARDPGSPGDDYDPNAGGPDEGQEHAQGEDAEAPDDAEDEFPDGDDADDEDGEVEDALGEGDGDAAAARGQTQETRTRDGLRQGRRTTSDEIRDLRRRAQEAERRNQEFQQQLAQVMQGRSQADLAREQQQEQERLALMSPEERTQYEIQQLRRENQYRDQQYRAALFEQTDKIQYDNLVAQNPTYRRFDDKVEELRRQAPNVPRRILLATAIGMSAMERGGQARTRAQNTAERRARANVTNPPGGRGAATGRQRQGGSLEDRLRGQLI